MGNCLTNGGIKFLSHMEVMSFFSNFVEQDAFKNQFQSSEAEEFSSGVISFH